jgi:hypothetical protein
MGKALTKSELVLSKEEYPEPKTKAGFPALIREILDLPGGVARIILEKGQPVRAWRWVEKNDLYEEGPTLDGALTHAEIIEYINPDPAKTAPEELFHMMLILSRERHIPVCWATGREQSGLLRKWLRVEEQGVPFDGDDLLNIPIERLKSLPEDTLLLCGASHINAGLGDVVLAVKLAIELREKTDVEKERKRDAAGSRHSSTERGGSIGEVSTSSSGSIGKSWSPPSFLRKRFSRCS